MKLDKQLEKERQHYAKALEDFQKRMLYNWLYGRQNDLMLSKEKERK